MKKIIATRSDNRVIDIHEVPVVLPRVQPTDVVQVRDLTGSQSGCTAVRWTDHHATMAYMMGFVALIYAILSVAVHKQKESLIQSLVFGGVFVLGIGYWTHPARSMERRNQYTETSVNHALSIGGLAGIAAHQVTEGVGSILGSMGMGIAAGFTPQLVQLISREESADRMMSAARMMIFAAMIGELAAQAAPPTDSPVGNGVGGAIVGGCLSALPQILDRIYPFYDKRMVREMSEGAIRYLLAVLVAADPNPDRLHDGVGYRWLVALALPVIDTARYFWSRSPGRSHDRIQWAVSEGLNLGLLAAVLGRVSTPDSGMVSSITAPTVLGVGVGSMAILNRIAGGRR